MARGRGGLSQGTDVLVVGAGPTGLTTALQAHANGASVRIVERRAEPFRPSRAMIMHSRTLEVLRPLGVVEPLLDRADRAPRAQLHLGARTVVAQLGDVGLRDTAYPHLTLVRQADVEDVLASALEARGVPVERDAELVGASWTGAGVRALLRADGEIGEVVCRYLAGCDGADSLLRRLTGIGWQGGRYGQEVVLADVELDGGLAPGMLHVAAGTHGLVFLFALGEGATWRLLGTRPAAPEGQGAFGQPSGEVPVVEVQRLLDDSGLRVRVTEQVWSARVPLQHRIASSFRQGPVFLAGDAAHAGSPAGGQGMNTGIVDAVNLGWKIAVASRGDPGTGAGGAHAALLGTYDLERRPAAAQVLALTHLIFFAEASTRRLPAFVRGTVLPLAAPALPLLLRRRALMAAVVELLSQRWVRYRSSPLSVTGTPTNRGACPGDRLPDRTVTCGGRPRRLHDLTARPGLHVLLERDTVAPELHLAALPVTVHRIDGWPGSGLVVVRPDGHVGYRTGRLDGGDLSRWRRQLLS
ncbi:FAD-dependent monooxygenase [Terracoccus sp. 273MFTsu3.1]|uniref:FAD-dependent monooxygenase n=1 Tax=Terracoccus sp. 273MFTsu3.1 TaxID=1172188 RepID=UPI0003623936|nr:FAD-dependent monooxygenase [Terracoccus sp. 273MFTsu3.1]